MYALKVSMHTLADYDEAIKLGEVPVAYAQLILMGSGRTMQNLPIHLHIHRNLPT